MGIREQVMADIKSAMKDKDTERLGALRFLQAAFKNREIELRPNPITEDDLLGVLRKSVKQRKESIDQYQQAGRTDLVEKESAELKLLESYLPQQMSRDQIQSIVTEVISALGASSIKDMGAVMKEVQTRTAGAADNKTISELVKAKLQP